MPGFSLKPYRPMFADHYVDAYQLRVLRETFITDSFDPNKMHCIFHSRDRVFTFFNPHPHIVEEVRDMTAFERLRRFTDAGAIVGAYAGAGDSSTEKVLQGLQGCDNRFVWMPLGEESNGESSITFQLLYVPNINSYCTAPCSPLKDCEVPEVEEE